MSLRYTGCRRLPMPSGSVVRSFSTVPAIAYATTSGGDARKFALRFGWMRASKLRLPDSTAAQTRSLLDDRVVDLGREVAGVADARRAAVGGDGEAELLEIGQEPGLGQVVGDHARARRERGLDVRLDREAVLDGLLREQARGEQHARVRRVGARRDRGDQHVAVADATACSRDGSRRDRASAGC